MHQHQHEGTAAHAPQKSFSATALAYFLRYIHDTELWASYLPRIPARLYLLALVGAVIGAGVFYAMQYVQPIVATIGIILGVLLLLPSILMRLFVRWRWGKRFSVRQQILDSISWRGDEKALDVGCGSGLLLNGMATRLKTGRATGIDLWTDHGGGGNLDLLWRNARAEGVADRIEFKEADARKLPFENETFDVVASSGAAHHIIRSQSDFDQVMHEMARVLKPGGHIVIWDVEHMVAGCAARMTSLGLKCEVKKSDKFLGYDMSIVFAEKPG